MENQRKVVCQENEDLASFLWKKRQDMAEPNGISENLDLTLSKAYRSICDSKSSIKTIKDLSQVKGVGKWIIRLLQSYFGTESRSEDSIQNEKNNKRSKRYVPQKNSAAYAILITLYRETSNGTDFMRKQELIDAAEASGLSRVSIGPEKGAGKLSQSYSRDWYIGWNCMKTLVTKGLVVRSSCPAKSHSRRFIENICSQFRIQVEVRRLPVGDGIWIARHKYLNTEHVLDFIVERKKVDDLSSSIRDNRYRDQKLRLLRCGLHKLIYLVEGDPNSLEASESIKTAFHRSQRRLPLQL